MLGPWAKEAPGVPGLELEEKDVSGNEKGRQWCRPLASHLNWISCWSRRSDSGRELVLQAIDLADQRRSKSLDLSYDIFSPELARSCQMRALPPGISRLTKLNRRNMIRLLQNVGSITNIASALHGASVRTL